MNLELTKTNLAHRVWHPYTRFSSLQNCHFPNIVRGRGVYLEDSDGKQYVDAISSWWATPLGHSFPEIIEAICKQATELQHSIIGNMTHPNVDVLAREITKLMPNEDYHVHFSCDGASAVEAALKICLQYWSNKGKPRSRFVSLNRAYHGDTLAALSMGYIDEFHRPFSSLLIPSERLPVPPYDGTEDECINAAKTLFREHGSSFAGMIVEPLCQGAAGMRIYEASYLNVLFALCREHAVVFIVDEIATGFGRTGKMFAFEHASVEPDIMCIGKALSGGALPISATVVRDSIYNTFHDIPLDHTFYHGHTYAGNPIACAAALAAIRAYKDLDIARCAEQRGRLLSARLSSLENLPGVVNVRYLGMIGAVTLRSCARASIESPAQQVQRNMLTSGYIVRPLGDVVYLMLPLVTPEGIIKQVVEALRNAIVTIE